MTAFSRSFDLLDMSIRSGGDGRTVEMYAAVFNTPTTIRDQQGTYQEQISPDAFKRTVGIRGTNIGVFYNHAKTMYGTPSDMGSVPIGSPVEPPRADSRGLVTVTRYNNSPLADSVLEAIKAGDIKSQSFSGTFMRSTPEPARGRKYAPAADGSLTLVTRNEIALREYGPTPIPAYDEPMLIGVRSIGEDGVYPPTPRQIALSAGLEDVVETFGKFDQGDGPDGAHYMNPSPFAGRGMACSNCYFYDGPRACELVDGDIAPDAVCKFWIIPEALLSAPTTTPTPPDAGPGRNATPDPGPGAETDPRDSTPSSTTPSVTSLRWKAREKGVLK